MILSNGLTHKIRPISARHAVQLLFFSPFYGQHLWLLPKATLARNEFGKNDTVNKSFDIDGVCVCASVRRCCFEWAYVYDLPIVFHISKFITYTALGMATSKWKRTKEPAALAFADCFHEIQSCAKAQKKENKSQKRNRLEIRTAPNQCFSAVCLCYRHELNTYVFLFSIAFRVLRSIWSRFFFYIRIEFGEQRFRLSHSPNSFGLLMIQNVPFGWIRLRLEVQMWRISLNCI